MTEETNAPNTLGDNDVRRAVIVGLSSEISDAILRYSAALSATADGDPAVFFNSIAQAFVTAPLDIMTLMSPQPVSLHAHLRAFGDAFSGALGATIEVNPDRILSPTEGMLEWMRAATEVEAASAAANAPVATPLDVSKSYRTRDGLTTGITVRATDPDNEFYDPQFPFVVADADDPTFAGEEFTALGSYWQDGEPHDYDLIEEEPAAAAMSAPGEAA